MEQENLAGAREDIAAGLRLSHELGLSDQEVLLLALQGAAYLDAGDPQSALAATTAAVAKLVPGVEMDQSVLHIHARALAAVGRRAEADSFVEQAFSRLTDQLAGLDPDQRQRALRLVPEHAAIVTAHRARSVVTETVLLARRDAPTGRRLTATDMTAVTWTIASPEDDLATDDISRRRARLLRLVNEAVAQQAAPTVGDLAGALGVSEATVRRDAAHLRAQGVGLPTRGARA